MPPFHLQTLGGLRLTNALGEEILPGRRKLLALLAYLALAPRPPVPRPELADAFWGDGPPERAGASLRKALSTVRAALGAALVETEAGLRVDERLFRCDVHELGRAAGGRGVGTFLPSGEELGDAPFRFWLEGERARIARLMDAQRGDPEGEPSALPVAAPDPPSLELHLAPPPGPTPPPSGASALTGLLGSLREAPGVGGAADQDLARLAIHHPWLRRRYPSLPAADPRDASDAAALAGALGRTLASVAEEVPVILVEGEPDRLDPLSREVFARLVEDPPPGVAIRAGAGAPGRGTAAPAVGPPREAGRRRVMAWGAALVILVLLTVVGVGSAARAGARDSAPVAATTPERLVVLPFAVRGSPEVAYLAEGMVDLLALNLAGTGVVEVVDPHSTLALLGSTGSTGSTGEGRPDPGEVARRLGAGLLVRGSVVEAGGRLRISGTLVDGAGVVVASGDAGPGDEADLFLLADDLARQLLAGILAAPGEELNRSAAHSTPSLPALRAFLEGERLFRMGRYAEAEARFRAAAAHDPDFALAHFRTAVALEWTGGGSPHSLQEALEAALARAQGLSPRDVRLLEGFAAYHRGDATEAERQLRAVLSEDPTHVGAWLLLAEVLFHLGPRSGRPDALTAAGEAFDRVLELAPDHEEALVHRVRIAAAAGKWEEVAALHRRVRSRLHPSAPILFPISALDAALAPDPRHWAQFLYEARGESPLGVVVAAGFLATYAGLPDRSGELIRLLTHPSGSPELRGMAHLRLALLAAQEGRWDAAEAEVEGAWDLAPRLAAQVGGLLLAHPGAPITRETRLRMLDRLDISPPAQAGALPFLTDHPGLEAEVDAYVMGLLRLALGDGAGARRGLEALREAQAGGARPPEAALLQIREGLRAGLEADILRAEGDPQGALRTLDGVELGTWHQWAMISPLASLARERGLRAHLLEELGRHPEAEAWRQGSALGATPFEGLFP
jgi:TolB-like protein